MRELISWYNKQQTLGSLKFVQATVRLYTSKTKNRRTQRITSRNHFQFHVMHGSWNEECLNPYLYVMISARLESAITETLLCTSSPFPIRPLDRKWPSCIVFPTKSSSTNVSLLRLHFYSCIHMLWTTVVFVSWFNSVLGFDFKQIEREQLNTRVTRFNSHHLYTLTIVSRSPVPLLTMLWWRLETFYGG